MEFFDSKQEVIDIRLTQFGKRLLARGYFKPVYYQFFDDDILYDSERAGSSEKQNATEARIIETPRIKTQHVTVGIETSFDEEQRKIDDGTAEVFKEITKNQDPLASEKLLKYSLEKSEINSQEAPRFVMTLHGPEIRSCTNTVETKGIEAQIPQINITSSYTIIRDNREKKKKIPKSVVDSENYLDLTSDEVEFLDKSKIILNRQDLIIDLEEHGVDLSMDNFEIEIYEIVESEDKDGKKKENLTKLRNHNEIKKYFDIKRDSMVEGAGSSSRDGRHSPRGRGHVNLGGKK